jgi:hypothetical protein
MFLPNAKKLERRRSKQKPKLRKRKLTTRKLRRQEPKRLLKEID